MRLAADDKHLMNMYELPLSFLSRNVFGYLIELYWTTEMKWQGACIDISSCYPQARLKSIKRSIKNYLFDAGLFYLELERFRSRGSFQMWPFSQSEDLAARQLYFLKAWTQSPNI